MLLQFPAMNGKVAISFHIHCQDELVHSKQVAVSYWVGPISHTQRGKCSLDG